MPTELVELLSLFFCSLFHLDLATLHSDSHFSWGMGSDVTLLTARLPVLSSPSHSVNTATFVPLCTLTGSDLRLSRQIGIVVEFVSMSAQATKSEALFPELSSNSQLSSVGGSHMQAITSTLLLKGSQCFEHSIGQTLCPLLDHQQQ